MPVTRSGRGGGGQRPRRPTLPTRPREVPILPPALDELFEWPLLGGPPALEDGESSDEELFEWQSPLPPQDADVDLVNAPSSRSVTPAPAPPTSPLAATAPAFIPVPLSGIRIRAGASIFGSRHGTAAGARTHDTVPERPISHRHIGRDPVASYIQPLVGIPKWCIAREYGCWPPATTATHAAVTLPASDEPQRDPGR
jgi:hypothetical protein